MQVVEASDCGLLFRRQDAEGGQSILQYVHN